MSKHQFQVSNLEITSPHVHTGPGYSVKISATVTNISGSAGTCTVGEGQNVDFLLKTTPYLPIHFFWDPWYYDFDDDGVISEEERDAAVADWQNYIITMSQLGGVIAMHNFPDSFVKEYVPPIREVTLDAGQSEVVSFLVRPLASGTYDVSLDGLSAHFVVRGAGVLYKEVTLTPGQSLPVNFEVKPTEPGDYSVSLGTLTGSFESLIHTPEAIRPELIAYYRDNYGTPGVMDVFSVQAALVHYYDDITVPGFGYPVTKKELDAMILEWENRPIREEILSYYRDNYGEPGVMCFESYMAASSAYLHQITEDGFDYPITWQEFMAIVDEYQYGPLANLKGVVKDANTQNPIVGAMVELNTDIKYTDADGKFSFVGKVPGSYILTISKEGYVTQSGEVYLDSGDNDIGDVFLGQALANVTGKVRHSIENAQVVHAQVDLNGETTHTNVLGDFYFEGLEPGQYTLTISKDGFETKSIPILLYSGNNDLGDIYLTPLEAEFEIDNLVIDPLSLYVGEEVTIAVDVENVGDAPGTCVISTNPADNPDFLLEITPGTWQPAVFMPAVYRAGVGEVMQQVMPLMVIIMMMAVMTPMMRATVK